MNYLRNFTILASVCLVTILLNFQKKREVNHDKLKKIEEELNNLKCKYEKLESDSKDGTKNVNADMQNQHKQEITVLKNACQNFENDKLRLQKDLEEIKTVHASVKLVNSRLEKDLSELKCKYQELQAEKSEKEIGLKKYLDDKKFLNNRIQELVAIGN